MGGKITYAFLSTALIVVFAVVVLQGVLLLRTGEPAAMGMGAVAFVLPCVGAWFLWHNTRFARNANRLARELEAEGGLPEEDASRTPGGRIDRAAADEIFARRKREAEASPDDWRCWFRLAVAYHDARDTPRARKAMQRAIALHDGGSAPDGRKTAA
ncbi:hypothetical protein GCM10010420_23900 [Streptomyces glaucosporus]|uniref:Tetratricopeptide repeat protein n=1 Tax=Streptomyces glaucosporus TaxID=284044 RepID=A0ABP5V9J8_9ACTN